MNKVINSKKRNDVKIKNSGGFTLVELLAVLAILSIVSVIVSYTATNVIASAKEKSYKVTINNIEKEANTYVLENNKNITWLNYDGTADSYQCIVVQDLIDMGYFDNSVLDSKVSKDRNVRANDYIYMEKDNNTNAITKQVLIFNDNLSYSNICLYYINSDGSINIFAPSGWAKSKNVTITYKLGEKVNYTDLSNYKYDYQFDYKCDDGSGINDNCGKSIDFTTSKIVSKELTVYNEGDVNASIKTQNNFPVVPVKTFHVDKIDTESPVIESNSSSQTVRKSAIIPIKVIDNKSGVDDTSVGVSDFKVSIGGNLVDESNLKLEKIGYDNDGNEINYYDYNLIISDKKNIGEVVIEIEENAILDKVANGNKETEIHTGVIFSNMYYIKYNVNGGTGTMEDSICYDGDNCTLSKNKFNWTSHTFLGWSIDKDTKEATYADEYKFESYDFEDDIILYAIWRKNVVYINYKVNEGEMLTDGTAGNGYKTGNGYVLYKGGTKVFNSIQYDSKLDNNGLKNYDSGKYFSISKTGYTGINGAEWKCISDSCKNKTYRDECSSGSDDCQYKANDFCDASNGDCTVELEVNWKINTYTISYNACSGTGAPSSQTKTYGIDLTLSSTVPTRTGYNFLGWSTASNCSDATSKNYDSGSIYQINAGDILYAVWEPKIIKVTYHRNQSSSDTTTLVQTFTYGQSGNKFGYNTDGTAIWGTSGDFGAWSNLGYKMLGWSVSQNATTKQYDTYSGVADSWINDNSPSIDLYAVWELKTVKVTYHRNQSSSDTTTLVQTFTYGQSGNKFGYNTDGTAIWGTSGDFGAWSNLGYKMLGWSTNKSATSSMYSKYSGVSDEWINSNSPSIELYAVWQPKYKIYEIDETKDRFIYDVPYYYHPSGYQNLSNGMTTINESGYRVQLVAKEYNNAVKVVGKVYSNKKVLVLFKENGDFDKIYSRKDAQWSYCTKLWLEIWVKAGDIYKEGDYTKGDYTDNKYIIKDNVKYYAAYIYYDKKAFNDDVNPNTCQ